MPSPNATLRRRIASLLYESFLLTAVLLVAGFLFAPIASLSPGAAMPGTGLRVPPLPARVLLFCALFGIGALYFTWSWTGGRRTLPMKTWRMRIAMRDGQPVRWPAALARYGATWIGPGLALGGYLLLRPAGHGHYALLLLAVGFLWAFVDADRQFLHDRIAGTRIVADTA